MSESLVKLVASLALESARFQRDLDKQRANILGFEKAANAALAGVGKAFAAIGGTAAIGAFIKQTVAAGDRLDELGQKTGVSVESLSRLGYAAKFSGVDVETLSDAMGKAAKFAAALEQGAKGPAETLKALGISTQDYLALSPDDRLLRVADAFQAHADGSGKAAAAMAFFGKSGANLIPFLDLGAQSIRDLGKESDELGNTMDQETATAFANLSDASDRLIVTLASSLRPAVVELATPLTSLADLLTENTVRASEAQKEYSLFANTMKGVATEAILVASGIELVAISMGGIGRTIWQVLAGKDPLGPGKSLLKMIGDFQKGVTDARDQLDALWQPNSDTESLLTSKADGIPSHRPEIHLRDTSGDAAAKSAAKAIQAQVDALTGQAATLGMTTEQVKLYELAQDGATEAQLASARAAVQQIEDYDAREQVNELSKQNLKDIESLYETHEGLIKNLTSDQQQYIHIQEDLNNLLAAGRITQDEYNAALGRAHDELEGLKSASEFARQGYDSIADAFGNSLERSLEEWKGWKDAGLGFLKDVQRGFAKLAADMAKQALFGGSGSGAGGGINWGGILGKLAGSLFGGLFGGGASAGGSGYIASDGLYNTTIGAQYSFASGGLMPANRWSLVGENGPELVMSHSPARVFNNDDTEEMLGRGGTNVYNNWTFHTPDADSFRASRRQIQRKEKLALGMA